MRVMTMPPWTSKTTLTCQSSADSSDLGRSHGRPIGDGVTSSLFEDAYRQRFGNQIDGEAIRLTNFRTTATVRRDVYDGGLRPDVETREVGTMGTRSIRFKGEWHNVRILDQRSAELPDGHEVKGPAVVERLDGTIVIPPSWVLKGDRGSNFVLTQEPQFNR